MIKDLEFALIIVVYKAFKVDFVKFWNLGAYLEVMGQKPCLKLLPRTEVTSSWIGRKETNQEHEWLKIDNSEVFFPAITYEKKKPWFHIRTIVKYVLMSTSSGI